MNLCNVRGLTSELNRPAAEASERNSLDEEEDIPARLNFENDPLWKADKNNAMLLPQSDGRLEGRSSM
jgi:hypothetical protein